MTVAHTERTKAVARSTSEAVGRVALLATNGQLALLADAGIRYETLLRKVFGFCTGWVADVYGMSTRTSVERLAERLSALEYRLEQLETSGSDRHE